MHRVADRVAGCVRSAIHEPTDGSTSEIRSAPRLSLLVGLRKTCMTTSGVLGRFAFRWVGRFGWRDRGCGAGI
jgi:hypothetical protein